MRKDFLTLFLTVLTSLVIVLGVVFLGSQKIDQIVEEQNKTASQVFLAVNELANYGNQLSGLVSKIYATSVRTEVDLDAESVLRLIPQFDKSFKVVKDLQIDKKMSGDLALKSGGKISFSDALNKLVLTTISQCNFFSS